MAQPGRKEEFLQEAALDLDEPLSPCASGQGNPGYPLKKEALPSLEARAATTQFEQLYVLQFKDSEPLRIQIF